MPDAIVTEALRKVYAAPRVRRRVITLGRPSPFGAPPAGVPAPGSGHREVLALDGLDLAVKEGEFFGLLGPNGAGKTTTIGILTTRVRATAGTALVRGIDVARDPVRVRQCIGVVPQRPNPDRSLTIRENLLFHADYFGIPRAESSPRATRLLELFGIGDRSDARVDQLSGGQQQRLMIVRALMHEPGVLFLDEPTVGLDPQARLALWDILRGLHAEGRTIVMTTHYMEEADRLCERVAIVDRGRLLACDPPAVLKARAPGGTLIILSLDADAEPVRPPSLQVPGVSRVLARGRDLHVSAERPAEVIPGLIRAAEQVGHVVREIQLNPPSLETLFVSLTGRTLE